MQKIYFSTKVTHLLTPPCAHAHLCVCERERVHVHIFLAKNKMTAISHPP